jgi:hypothetical protein
MKRNLHLSSIRAKPVNTPCQQGGSPFNRDHRLDALHGSLYNFGFAIKATIQLIALPAASVRFSTTKWCPRLDNSQFFFQRQVLDEQCAIQNALPPNPNQSNKR